MVVGIVGIRQQIMLYEFDECLLKQATAPPCHQPSRRHPIVVQNYLCKANVSSKLGDDLERHILVVKVLVEVTICTKVQIFLQEKEKAKAEEVEISANVILRERTRVYT